VGDAAVCAAKIAERIEAGADGVVIHSSRARHLGPLLGAWHRFRPVQCRTDAPANPGYST
jgi:hypothetical protein